MDEADRLLDMGFQKTIGTIIAALEKRAADAVWPAWSDPRQTVLLSATLTPSLRELAGSALRDPAVVRLDAAAALPRAAPPPSKKAASAGGSEDADASGGDAVGKVATTAAASAGADYGTQLPNYVARVPEAFPREHAQQRIVEQFHDLHLPRKSEGLVPVSATR